MKLNKVSQVEKSEYPSYEGYQTNRRKFLKKLVAGAGALVASAAALDGCQGTQTAGAPRVVTKGKVRQSTDIKKPTARTPGVPKQEHPPLPGVAPRPATAQPPGEPPMPTPAVTPSKETTSWMGVKDGDKPEIAVATRKPVVLGGKPRMPTLKKPAAIRGDIACPEPTGK